MKLKYKILKALDVTGFTVFDPFVRLIYGEEPQKQVQSIFKFFVAPIFFILFCFMVWSFVAPNHKTKSGEVPTPSVVWDSAKINHVIAKRENTKAEDFVREGKERQAELERINSQSEIKALEVDELRAVVVEKETELKARQDKLLAPISAEYDILKAEFKGNENVRKAYMDTLSTGVTNGEVKASALIAAIREDSEKKSLERATLDELKNQMDEIRSEKYKPLEAARKAADSAADELFFLKTRQEYLEKRNLSQKIIEAEGKLEDALAKVDAGEDGKKALLAAKSAVRQETSIERMKGQEYPKAATIYHYIKRSLFTVFIGFLMATLVAIPVGILCGLNKVVMACLTPIIAIFKPVSPVVWLLIFQIVVGAFFPDPDNHPLFRFFGSLPFVSGLGVNPAMIFSACTVAMCAVWPSLVNTALGVASIDKDHLNVARVLRLGFFDRLFKIIIPSALPLVFAGLRISMGVGWMVLIAAEALSSSDGLGKFVWDEYQNGSSLTFANIIFACFVVGIIGFFLDRLMIVFQRLVSFDGAPTAV